jgi:hypothetical protein
MTQDEFIYLFNIIFKKLWTFNLTLVLNAQCNLDISI